MGNNSGNQIKAKMIASHGKKDRPKLAAFERLIHRKFTGISVAIEPFMLFSKGENEYLGTKYTLDETETKRNIIHPPDMILYVKGKMVVFELDGSIHDTKRIEKTNARNKMYEVNEIEYIVINEAELLIKLGMNPDKDKLTQDQLDEEFTLRIKEFIKDN